MTIQKIRQLTDEQLVTLFQETGNNDYFGEIYNRHYKKVYHTCLGIVKDREVAFDLVQDVMIKVMENLPALQNGFLLGLWIFRIARNHSVDYCKECGNRLTINADERFDLVEETIDMEAVEAKENLLDSVGQILDELREDDRTFLLLKYFDHYSVKDLQNKYTLSESAVKMRLARARKHMVDLYHKKHISQLSL